MPRGKRAAAVSDEPVEEPWELPEGWRWERLGNVAPVNPRRVFDLSDNTEVPFLPMASVAERTGKIDLTQRRMVSQVKQGFTRFRSGDVIFAKITPCMENGKLAVIPQLPDEVGAGSTEFHVLEPQGVTDRFIFHWLSQQVFRDQAEHNMTGTAGQKRVPTPWLAASPVPVPPKPVQEALTKHIDALFAEIDDGEAALAEARLGVETYRKALLKAAMTGELTADWRRDNPATETGQDLLQCLLADRRRRWEAEPTNGKKRYLAPPRPNLDDLPKLPMGWVWASLEELTFISGGATVDQKRKPLDPVTVPYLRVANVQRGKLDLSKMKDITIEASALDGLRLADGDILLNEGGDRDKVGRGWVWRDNLPTCVHQNHVFKARPASPVIQPELVSAYLNEMGRKFFMDESKQTTNLASISKGKVSLAPVPVPPAAEAAEIVERLRHNEREADDETAEQASAAAKQLRQSILSAAFRGQLT